jgi:hypothetical protein
MFHLLQMYVASVLPTCFICFMHILQVHLLNVSVVLNVYCICFMLSVSCFIGMFGGAHGFVRACA